MNLSRVHALKRNVALTLAALMLAPAAVMAESAGRNDAVPAGIIGHASDGAAITTVGSAEPSVKKKSTKKKGKGKKHQKKGRPNQGCPPIGTCG